MEDAGKKSISSVILTVGVGIAALSGTKYLFAFIVDHWVISLIVVIGIVAAGVYFISYETKERTKASSSDARL
jgi:hypothetical protein